MLKLTVVGCGDANQENWVEYVKSGHGGKFAGKNKKPSLNVFISDLWVKHV